LLFALVALFCASQDASDASLGARLASGPGGYDEALAEQIDTQQAGAELFESAAPATLAERRARARWFDRYGADEAFPGALRALEGEADRRARRDLLRGLAAHADGAERRAEVAEAFRELGARGPTTGPAGELIAAAVALAGEQGAALLDEWIDEWAAPERRAAAEALGELRSGGARIERRLERAFEAEPAERPDAQVLAALLAAYGRHWGEDREGLDLARRRIPIELGLSHPAPEVRRAAMIAVDAFLRACRRLETPERADDLLAGLASGQRDPRPFEALRAEHALTRGMDPSIAIGVADRLASSPLVDLGDEWKARAAYYRGMAELAAGDPQSALRALDRSAAMYDEALAQRVDLARDANDVTRPGTGDRQAGRLAARAEVELARCLTALSDGRPGTDLRVLELCRRVHALSLEAQVAAATSSENPDLGSFDDLLAPESAPTRLLFSRPPHTEWPADRAFRVRAELGRGLASVASFEFPGFEPAQGLSPALADPEQDPQRAHLLAEIPGRRRTMLQERAMRLEMRAVEQARAGERMTPEEETELAILRWQLNREVDDPPMEELRAPSSFALWLAEDMREDGRSSEARTLARALLDALEAQELDVKTGMGLNLAIEAQLVVGGSLTDEGEGELAEEQLLRAVERLEGLENLIVERGGDEIAAQRIRVRRAGALVSLAVNANVKLGETERALEYFERAHELAPTEAGDVLLACYRARMGQAAEARAILAEVLEAPSNYYNLACTHALLGDADRALHYLERDFTENHPTPGSLRRQQDWAKSDPDLDSLRELPRFQELLAAEPGELLR
jgi:tetratricopeptide (TPR) repeat protein